MLNICGMNRAYRADDHTENAEKEQHVMHAAGIKNLRTNDIVDQLDQKENVALGNNAGENTTGGRNRFTRCTPTSLITSANTK